MLKKIIFPIGLFSLILIQSCSEPTHPDAESLCNCYTQMYRADGDRVDVIADSCSTIYIDIIKKLKDNPEEKAKFDEAYAFCQ